MYAGGDEEGKAVTHDERPQHRALVGQTHLSPVSLKGWVSEVHRPSRHAGGSRYDDLNNALGLSGSKHRSTLF